MNSIPVSARMNARTWTLIIVLQMLQFVVLVWLVSSWTCRS